jgi:hypothetical protein
MFIAARAPAASDLNLTGYCRSTAYSLAFGLCQDVLQMRPEMAMMGAPPCGKYEKVDCSVL